MSRACRFCGSTDTKLSKEHLWPNWVRELFPSSGRVTHTMTHRDAASAEETSFPATPFTMRVRLVCRPCNSGWMSEIESRMCDLASGMIQGRGRVLHPSQQTTVATWATLKAFVFHALHPAHQRAVPAHHYADLYALQREPPEYVRVFLARYGGQRPGFYDHRALTREDSGVVEAYSATISVGRLVVSVVGPTVEPIDDIRRGRIDAHLRRIWPPNSKPVTVPFSRDLTTAELDRLAGPPPP